MAPDYLRHLIHFLTPSKYNLRRNHDSGVLLTSPRVRTKNTLGDRSFSCAAPRLRNLLSSTIRSISSLTIFKRRLKTFLFNKLGISLVTLAVIRNCFSLNFNC